MLLDIINYLPDPKNGRPIANGKVYFLIQNYKAPDRDSDLDLTKLAQVRADGLVLPQPLYTTQGGTYRVGSATYIPMLSVSDNVTGAAAYDKCGKLIFQAAYGSGNPCALLEPDFGFITDAPDYFIDFGLISEPVTCEQDLGFLPNVIALATDSFSLFASALSGGAFTVPFDITASNLDVYINGVLITDYSVTLNTITINSGFAVTLLPDDVIQVRHRYVTLN
jgi:hypothetical protein